MTFAIADKDRFYIDRIRGFSILRVVLMHLGLAWILTPYSQLIGAFLPVLFFASGAVSYFSFMRAKSLKYFAFRRLSTLTLPYFLMTGPIILFYGIYNRDVQFDFYHLYQWLTFAPSSQLAPFSLAHLWFIHSLVIMTILAIPVFIAAKSSTIYLYVALFVGLIICFIQTFTEISRYFYQVGHNLFQPLAYSVYFFLGAIYYARRECFSWKINAGISAFFLFLSVFFVIVMSFEINLADHGYSPNMYYTSASMSALFFVLSIQKPMTDLLKALPILDRFILIFCTNAYSIYIIHPALIMISEVWLGLEGVAESIPHAILKVLFVIIGSILISIPITRATGLVVSYFKAFGDSGVKMQYK